MALVPTPLLERVEYLLCDADGNLFPSEEPAFDASVEVTNAFLAEIGSDQRFTAEELRLASTGMNFRTTAQRLAAEAGAPDVDVEPWVAEEKRAVSAHLAASLRPHAPTSAALTAMAEHLSLAAVSSSARAPPPRPRPPGRLPHRPRPRRADSGRPPVQRRGFAAHPDQQARSRRL